jgi:bacteriocin biosynthesis cyclodehydratase domain-containing protein
VKLEIRKNRIVCLPVQFIETAAGVVLKRGCTEVQIRGEGVQGTVGMLLAKLSGKGMDREDAVELFGAAERDAVNSLIQQLLSRRILVEADALPAEPIEEDRVDIFYWDLGHNRRQAEAKLSERSVTLVGVNPISRRVASVLSESGCINLDVVDFPLLRNLELFTPEGAVKSGSWPENLAAPVDYEQWQDVYEPDARQCIVAVSDFGGLSLLREWNRFCVDNEVHFFPVVLQNLVGYLGPLVVPGESPCFECLIARQNSHWDDWTTARAVEEEAFATQPVAAAHPALSAMIGDLAALELLKFYGGGLPGWQVGSLIEVRPMVPALTTRRVLKVPRCTVCSPMNERSSASVEKFSLQAPGLNS